MRPQCLINALVSKKSTHRSDAIIAPFSYGLRHCSGELFRQAPPEFLQAHARLGRCLQPSHDGQDLLGILNGPQPMIAFSGLLVSRMHCFQLLQGIEVIGQHRLGRAVGAAGQMVLIMRPVSGVKRISIVSSTSEVLSLQAFAPGSRVIRSNA